MLRRGATCQRAIKDEKEIEDRFYKDLDELQTLCNIESINYIEMRNTATQIFGEIN